MYEDGVILNTQKPHFKGIKAPSYLKGREIGNILLINLQSLCFNINLISLLPKVFGMLVDKHV